MNQKSESKLEKTFRFGVPILAGLATATLLEYSGLSKHLQNYELAKVPLVEEYWGSIFSSLQVGAAYFARGVVDLSAAIIGTNCALEGTKKIYIKHTINSMMKEVDKKFKIGK